VKTNWSLNETNEQRPETKDLLEWIACNKREIKINNVSPIKEQSKMILCELTYGLWQTIKLDKWNRKLYIYKKRITWSCYI